MTNILVSSFIYLFILIVEFCGLYFIMNFDVEIATAWSTIVD